MENNINENIIDEHITHCEECGNEIEETDCIVIDEHIYCQGCVDDLFTWCEDECDYVRNDEVVRVYTDGYMRDYQYASSDYASRNYEYDSDEEEYFYNRDCGTYTHDGNFVCDRNYEGNYFCCDGCDGIYSQDYANWSDNDECYYCDDCYNDRDGNLIYNYHQFKDWRLCKNSDEENVPYYIGFELEIDNENDYNIREVHDLITSHINGVLAHDGSLSSRGIEIISHPQSYNYIIAQEEKYRDCFNKLINDYNFTSHENGRCGLHFHVTRPSDEIVDRIELIIENFRDELIKFSRRSDNHWCRYLGDNSNIDKDELKSIAYIKKHKGYHDRYMALNLTNSKTIEFRMMRGTLLYDTFRASLDLINTIMTIASDTSRDLTTLTWKELVNATDYISNYCVSRDIANIDKVVVDNTNKIEARDIRIKEYIKKYNKFIDNYKAYLLNEWNTKSIKIDKVEELKTISDLLYQTHETIKRLDYIQSYVSDSVNNGDIITLKANLNDTWWRIKKDDKWYYSRVGKMIKEVEAICVL